MNNRILSEVIENVKPGEEDFKVGSKIVFMLPDYVAIGNRIKEARKIANLTQTELADVVGLSQAAIVIIESGKVSLTIDNLFKFSEVLGQPVEYFLGVGVGELIASEVAWLQLFRDAPSDEARAIATELVEGYFDRLRRKGP